MGRPLKNVPDNFGQLVELWEKKKIPLEQVLTECNMTESTFYRRLREHRMQACIPDVK